MKNGCMGVCIALLFIGKEGWKPCWSAGENMACPGPIFIPGCCIFNVGLMLSRGTGSLCLAMGMIWHRNYSGRLEDEEETENPVMLVVSIKVYGNPQKRRV